MFELLSLLLSSLGNSKKGKKSNGESISMNKQAFIYFFIWVSINSTWAYNPERNFSASQVPEELKDLKTQEKLGNSLALDLHFTDERGKEVKLAQYFEGKQPVLLSIVYYACPNLCGLHLNALSEGLQDLSEDFRKEFQFVLVSMDEKETPTLALSKKKTYIEKYALLDENTHFLTGSKKNISALSKQVGFRFRWDDSQKIFAHLPVAYVLTPQGAISRYLYGVIFSAQTLRLSLVEASRGKIGSFVDRVLLFCFQFDPKRRRYAWYAYNIMRAGGVLTLLLILCFLFPVWIKESKKSKKGVS
ncbi:MAG: SCO family protein [Bdellovibrionales bacterium]|nr:SCO family protein [Bdellovibrionales bacterium]